MTASVADPNARGWTQAASEAFLESSPDAVVIIDATGAMVLVNAQTEVLFGHGRADLIGQHVEVLLPKRFREAHVAKRTGYVGEPRTRPMGAGLDLFGLRSDGTEFPIDISLASLETPQGSFFAAAVRDTTDRRRAEERVRAFLESAPDAVVVIERDGRIVIVNAQTEALFGYRREAMLGQSVEMLLPERFRGSHVAHRADYANEPRTRSMGEGLALFGRRADGSEFAIDISLAPLDTEQGLLLAATVRDVTERKRLEASRDQFIHLAAHELRTPLTTLATLGTTLAMHLHEMSAENVEAALDALKRQGERASSMVANLLDLSQLDTGRADVQLEPLAIAPVIARVVEGAPPPPPKMVTVDVAEDLIVLSGPVYLERLLTNLLTNAYRYGGPTITISGERRGPKVRLEVCDDGDGVPDDLVGQVFDPFTRGSKAGAVGGSGIGLALCQRIADAFGGSISYDRSRDGACFVLQLEVPR